ncbi:hypothetical protein V2J09_008267 [Rumex salicifolius]
MDSRRLFFDPSANSSHGNMLFLGTGNPGFRGESLMMSMEDSPMGRPLFFSSSSEELYDDEYYDEQLPEKKRRLTPEQVVMLEKSFETENKLEPEKKTQLAKKLGLQPRQVAVWFQNRRARWKTKQLEREFELLKSSYDALYANCESITQENDRLRTLVVSLTERLRASERNGPHEEEPGPKRMDPVAANPAQIPAQQLSAIAEELLTSSGSTTRGSAAVESGDQSYFPYPPPCVGPIDTVQSEEDDVSYDGQSCYLPGVFVAADDIPAQEGWSWVWN